MPRVTQKGQVTIPRQIRLILNIKTGDEVIFEKDRDKVDFKGIYNPYENFYRSGLGTTAYRDAWSLFDQILMTKPLLDKDYSTYKFYKAYIFNKYYLTTKTGRWKGYPFRSWADGGFSGGYSDHFPVYVYVIKEVED